MKPHRKKRLYWIMAILLGVGTATSLAMYALGQNVNLYLTPTQLAANHPSANAVFRIGGLVKKDTFIRDAHSLTVNFVLTDYQHDIPVEYTGILPTLFREGQGVVVEGKLNAQGKFVATEVLAKHDEKYMPPEIVESGK